MRNVLPSLPVRLPGVARRTSRQAALSRVLATATHEIRTPLSGIVGMADLLAGTPVTPEQTSYIEAIRTSALALASLVDELLDVSRIEAGKVDFADAPVDVARLVEGVVELLAPRAQGKGLEIASLVAPDVPAFVRGDAGRLRQVLLNLAGNAVKFTERGGVGLRVDVDGGALRFAIEDSGPGVPAARRAAIFEPFERGDGASPDGGAGLGLTISRQLVARMGGTLDLVASTPEGTIFQASLPLRFAGGPPARETLAGRRVLTVADGPFGQAYLGALLESWGAVVTPVHDVAHGRARLRDRPAPDALLVDAALGPAAVAALAAQARRAGVGRCLVLVSPYERRAFAPSIIGGYDGWLVKPVRPRSLAARLLAPAAEQRAAGRVNAALKVLVAEDDPVQALLATRYLERLGATCTHAATGRAAIVAWRAAEAAPFDVGLFDLHLPDIDGLGAAQTIRGDGAFRGRLIAMTAGATPPDAAALFDEIIPKPLDFGRLGRALEGLVPETGTIK